MSQIILPPGAGMPVMAAQDKQISIRVNGRAPITSGGLDAEMQVAGFSDLGEVVLTLVMLAANLIHQLRQQEVGQAVLPPPGMRVDGH